MNWKQDLEESLFNNNSKCEDFECDSAYVNHRIKGVFDKSRDEEMSQMSCDEYPCSEETKKNLWPKGGRKVKNNKYTVMANFPQIYL